MTKPMIVREDTPEGGRYVGTIDGIAGEGELTFRHKGPGLVVAVHTGVPPVFKGMGLGRALVIRMVEDARAQKFKIIPSCPYVDAERRKHPEWADAFAS